MRHAPSTQQVASIPFTEEHTYGTHLVEDGLLLSKCFIVDRQTLFWRNVLEQLPVMMGLRL